MPNKNLKFFTKGHFVKQNFQYTKNKTRNISFSIKSTLPPYNKSIALKNPDIPVQKNLLKSKSLINLPKKTGTSINFLEPETLHSLNRVHALQMRNSSLKTRSYNKLHINILP